MNILGTTEIGALSQNHRWHLKKVKLGLIPKLIMTLKVSLLYLMHAYLKNDCDIITRSCEYSPKHSKTRTMVCWNTGMPEHGNDAAWLC